MKLEFVQVEQKMKEVSLNSSSWAEAEFTFKDLSEEETSAIYNFVSSGMPGKGVISVAKKV